MESTLLPIASQVILTLIIASIRPLNGLVCFFDLTHKLLVDLIPIGLIPSGSEKHSHITSHNSINILTSPNDTESNLQTDLRLPFNKNYNGHTIPLPLIGDKGRCLGRSGDVPYRAHSSRTPTPCPLSLDLWARSAYE